MRLIALTFAISASAPAWADCADTGYDTGAGASVGDEDCDGDSWRKNQGDCADHDSNVNPGETESCNTPADDNCDGFYNEGCVRDVQRGSLLGGSSCGSGSAAIAFLSPLLFVLIRGRRR